MASSSEELGDGNWTSSRTGTRLVTVMDMVIFRTIFFELLFFYP